jgi:hypothetical protein
VEAVKIAIMKNSKVTRKIRVIKQNGRTTNTRDAKSQEKTRSTSPTVNNLWEAVLKRRFKNG